MLARLTISALTEHLPYRDTRTIEKWCHRNGIDIVEDGNKKYVYRIQLQVAFAKPLARLLKSRSDNWQTILAAHLRGDMNTLLELEQDTRSNLTLQDYTPRNKHEKEFLQKVEQLLQDE